MKTDEGAGEAADPDTTVGEVGEVGTETTGDVDPDEALKAKFREALAHKQDGSGVSGHGHTDAGHPDHPHGAAAQQRMFRRRAGG